MLLSAILVLLLVSLLLTLIKKPRASFATLLGAGLLLWLSASSFLASWLLGPLQRPYVPGPAPAWGQRNAILVLGGGNLRFRGEVKPTLLGNGRILETARLYRECRSGGFECKVLVSGGDPRSIGTTEAAEYGRRLTELGVAREDLILEDRSRNTFQNARFSAPILKGGAFDRVVLVTSGFHLTRAQLFLAHFGIRAQPVAGDLVKPVGAWAPSAYNLTLADLALNEYWGQFQYRLYNWTGRNPKPTA